MTITLASHDISNRPSVGIPGHPGPCPPCPAPPPATAPAPNLFGGCDGVDFSAARAADGGGGGIVCPEGTHPHVQFHPEKPNEVTLICHDNNDPHKK